MGRILLIEPDRVLAKLYVDTLSSEGMTAKWVASAQQAISQVDTLKPNLIILEMQLANHNGVEFLHELRSYNDWEHIPVVVLSVVPERELGLAPELRLQLGIVAYSYKPHTTLRQLKAIVNKHQLAEV